MKIPEEKEKEMDRTSRRPSLSSASGTLDSDEEDDEIKQVEFKVKKHTDRVRFWRLLVTFGLTATGVAVSTATYMFLLNQEETNFEHAFGQFSRTVGGAAVREMLRLREAVRNFGQVLEVSTRETNQTWPFYDFPSIEIFAKEQLDSKGMENIQYLTRVTHDQRRAWLDFEAQHYERWVKEGHMRAYGNLDVLVQSGYQDDILAVTAEGVVPSADKEEYWPLAYRYPPPNSYFVVGLDISSINYDDMFFSLKALKNQTLISNVNPYVESDEAEAEYHATFHSQLSDGSKAEHPHSFMFHPVHAEPQNADSEIVSMVLAPLAWDASLRNLMPDNVRGIVVVGRNNCGQNFTYLVEGRNAYFVRNEDMHDPHYDDKEYVVDLDFSDHPEFRSMPGHCAYTLSIYPNADFEADYASTTPMLFVIVVSCTFLLMVGVFFTYDHFQQSRNRQMVVDSARSNTIVANMFPGALRDKVLLDQQNKQEYYRRKKASRNKQSQTTDHVVHQGDDDSPQKDYADSILAELYPEASVIFADIVGFTKWSSYREPFEVFKLLETVYSCFDKKAKQLSIFKVETVGDCYVAVSGFPYAQADHAIRMCRFARHIVELFKMAITELRPVLGPETLELALRIGIHSGPVTAGVLRGERARVQLFGDTMNTAARMESTSKPWGIHVSEECANQLKDAGMSYWVSPREELVEAKGKGILRTYWLSPRSEARDERVESALATHDNVDCPDFGSEELNEVSESLKRRIQRGRNH